MSRAASTLSSGAPSGKPAGRRPTEDVSPDALFVAAVESTATGKGIPVSQRSGLLRSPGRGELAPDVVVAERFQLVRELGRGGMGAVWLANHLGLGVLCAVKFDLAGAASQEDLRRRFEREARAAALLRSPHVVQMLDHGIWDDRPYIAMEYLEGEDLRRRLDRVKRLSAEETERLIAQVARGLGKAHAASVIHRDLKPDNIFLTADPEGEVVKILDFGIATGGNPAALLTSTAGGRLLGTPAYMSPEQLARIGPVDHRSDLWSLGVIVFECLAGRRPFEGQSLGDLVLQILSRPIAAASKLAPDLPPGFDAWWARACSRDPKRRFQTAREFAKALAEALCEESTWPPSEASEPAPSPPLQRESAPPSGPSFSSSEQVTGGVDMECATKVVAERASSLDSAADGARCSTGAIELPRPRRSASSVRLVRRVAVVAMVLVGGVALLARWAPRSQPPPSAGAPSVALTAAPVATAPLTAELTAPAPTTWAAPVALATPTPVLVAPVATAPSKMGTSRSPASRAPAPARPRSAALNVTSEPVDSSLFDQRK